MTENRRKAEDKLRGFGGVCKNTAIGCGIKRAGQMASGKKSRQETGRRRGSEARHAPGHAVPDGVFKRILTNDGMGQPGVCLFHGKMGVPQG